MLRRSPLLWLAWLAIGACGPRLHSTRTATPPTVTPEPTAPTATATTATTSAPPPPPPTATVPPPPTTTATATTSAPPPVADDLVPACRFHCDSLRNACGAGDPSGCYKLCDEYDRTLARGCRGAMATYFRCLAWTVSCDGGQPRSDPTKCAADKTALDACKG